MVAMKEPAPPLASVLPGVSPAFAAVVDRALAFDKQDRWRSASEMLAEVRGAFATLGRRPRLGGGVVARSGAEPADPVDPISVNEVEAEEAPSLVAELAFAERRDQAIEDERRRTQEVAAALVSSG
jgi:serine/threonine-protein kinase